MIKRSMRLMWRGAVLAFLVYLLFFVERSAFQHLMRVADTDEAQELGREVSAATDRITKEIGEQVHNVTQPPAHDAGASQVPEIVSRQFQDVVGHAYDREQRIDAAREEQSQ
ncbi:MAG: hypothetical protein JRG93_09930 [Deltaproteobacteria bacterium]|nr:hypothetical protein [Deltaproteobacteria bacterium]